MADSILSLDPFSNKKTDPKPSVMGLMDDWRDDFETEQSLESNQTQIPEIFQKAFIDAPASLLDPTVKGVESGIKDTRDALGSLLSDIVGEYKPFSAKGSIDFQNKPKSEEEIKKREVFQYQKSFYASFEEAKRVDEKFDREQAVSDMVRLEVAGMSVMEKNKMEGLNLDLDNKHTDNAYHIHNIKMKKREQIKAMQRQKQDQDIAASKPKIVADFNAAAEGGMGRGSHRMSQASGGE